MCLVAFITFYPCPVVQYTSTWLTAQAHIQASTSPKTILDYTPTIQSINSSPAMHAWDCTCFAAPAPAQASWVLVWC